jgi:hypothetical protein
MRPKHNRLESNRQQSERTFMRANGGAKIFYIQKNQIIFEPITWVDSLV